MIPILYRTDEFFFLSNGLGRLSECTECTVTEERNGIFECEFKYPITGRFYDTMINDGGIVAVIHDDKHDIQPFDIYSYSAPIDGIVTFNAHHISYRLSNIIVQPFSAASCALAIDGLKTHSLNKNLFTFWTNKATAGNFNLTHPDNIRALLGGQEGSILDVYGTGEYEFDKYQVKLYLNRGVDTGVTIRYGKNLSDINRTFDEGQTFNALAPFWTDGSETVMLSDFIVVSPDAPLALSPWTSDTGDYITDDNGEIIYFQALNIQPVSIDFSSEFENKPTEAELRQKALDFLANNQPWTPRDNITVDFVQLWQTPEYENVASLQRVSLCDTVSIYYPELGVTATNAKIIRVVYNVLLERYDSMEVGTPKTSFADYLKGDISAAILEQPEFTGWQAAIAHATEMITGGLGGYVVMNANADGQPQEILIMDTDDINTAVHVIRMNKNGIGFSNNGYEGPFVSAWTIDGQFNADFIATGTLLANFIKGGTLLLGGLDDGNGVLELRDEQNRRIAQMNRYGLFMYSGGILLSQILANTGTVVSLTSTGGISTEYYNTNSTSGTAYRQAVLLGGYLTMSGQEYSSDVKVRIGQRHIEMTDYRDNGEVSFAVYAGYSSALGGYFHYYRRATQDLSALPVCGISCGLSSGKTYIYGDLTVLNGTKSRAADAGEYGTRSFYCYETPSPMFGDVGEGVIDETGFCYVFLDPVFAETISTLNYQVFLQKYGRGDCFVCERKPDYFVVQGEPGLAFGWELKAKQKDFSQLRLEREQLELDEEINYGEEGIKYYISLEEGRIA